MTTIADPISTSPLALQAFNVITHLDKLVGPFEAQKWMQQSNNHLGGDSPVAAIKQRRMPDVLVALRIVAMEKGLFEEPFLPPHNRKPNHHEPRSV